MIIRGTLDEWGGVAGGWDDGLPGNTVNFQAWHFSPSVVKVSCPFNMIFFPPKFPTPTPTSDVLILFFDYPSPRSPRPLRVCRVSHVPSSRPIWRT